MTVCVSEALVAPKFINFKVEIPKLFLLFTGS